MHLSRNIEKLICIFVGISHNFFSNIWKSKASQRWNLIGWWCFAANFRFFEYSYLISLKCFFEQKLVMQFWKDFDERASLNVRIFFLELKKINMKSDRLTWKPNSFLYSHRDVLHSINVYKIKQTSFFPIKIEQTK